MSGARAYHGGKRQNSSPSDEETGPPVKRHRAGNDAGGHREADHGDNGSGDDENEDDVLAAESFLRAVKMVQPKHRRLPLYKSLLMASLDTFLLSDLILVIGQYYQNVDEEFLPEMLTAEQGEIVRHIHEGKNVFLTGEAGSGKSYVMKTITRSFFRSMVKTASTGIAAITSDAQTAHSWFGIGLGTDQPKSLAMRILKSPAKKQVLDRLLRTKRVMIDEISMISADLFDLIDQVMQMVRKNKRPFGGLQLVLCGDFLQLPPVANRGDPRSGRYAFQAEAWPNTVQVNIHLNEQFRQMGYSQQAFVDILRRMRLGVSTDDDVRVMMQPRPPLASDALPPTILYALKRSVAERNDNMLATLNYPECRYTWIYTSGHTGLGDLEILKKQMPVEGTVTLKVGALVILVCNLSVRDGLANGTRGVVVGMNHAASFGGRPCPVVRFANGETRTVLANEWRKEDKRGRVLASIKQIPLLLGYAITIHRSQSMTLDCVEIDYAGIFEKAQAYVASSRARDLQNLYPKNLRKDLIKANATALEFYAKTFPEIAQYRPFRPSPAPAPPPPVDPFRALLAEFGQ